MAKRLMFVLFGIFAAVISFLAYSQSPHTLQQMDLRMKDARFRIRGPVLPDRNVIVVAIDHRSIRELGRWPWSREVTGSLIEKLAGRYGAKVSALDVVFSEPQNPLSDKALAESLKKAGNVVMGYFFRYEKDEIPADSHKQLDKAKLKLIRVDGGSANIPIPEFPGIDLSLPQIGTGALDSGFFNARPDVDGLYRRSMLLVRHDGNIYPSLAMKALSHYVDSDILLELKPWGVDTLQIGTMKIPAREDGTMTLNFYGKTGTFTTVSAADVIAERVPKETLAGKIVFVGATEIGIYDLRPTPFDATLPGVEIHATTASNALDRRFLLYDSLTRMMEIACIFLFPIILGAALAFAPGTFAGLGILAVTIGIFSVFNYLLFVSAFRDMTLIYPYGGIALTYLGGEAWRNLVVERKGRYLKKAFSSYVSPELVKQIEMDPDKLVLGGEQRQVTVLFSDIRGFTTVSENLPPPELVTLLNEYLTPMTRIILEERGTLDKFIGDAIMALFNAPLDVPAHAAHACTAAVRMIERLEKLNEAFAARGMNPIDIGVGIHSGPAVVGNMGADIRFDYTAIGNTVNLASRLEGLNKYYGSHVLVSEDTRRQVGDGGFTFRELDRVRVMGKFQPVVIHELLKTKCFIRVERNGPWRVASCSGTDRSKEDDDCHSVKSLFSLLIIHLHIRLQHQILNRARIFRIVFDKSVTHGKIVRPFFF